MKKFINKYENILNWIPVIGILFFVKSLEKYKHIKMFVDEFIFWMLYQTTMVMLLTEIIKNYARE
jgi:hypothetical protein